MTRVTGTTSIATATGTTEGETLPTLSATRRQGPPAERDAGRHTDDERDDSERSR